MIHLWSKKTQPTFNHLSDACTAGKSSAALVFLAGDTFNATMYVAFRFSTIKLSRHNLTKVLDQSGVSRSPTGRDLASRHTRRVYMFLLGHYCQDLGWVLKST